VLHRVLARKGLGPHAGAHDVGVDDHGAHAGVLDLVGPAAHHRLQPGLGRRIAAPEGLRPHRPAAGEEQRPAGLALAQQRLERADQPVGGGEIGGDDLVPQLGVHVPHGPEPAQHGGGMHHHVQPFVPLEYLVAQPVDPVAVGEVERHERWPRPVDGPDLVVQRLERPLDPPHRDHLRAGPRQRQRAGLADPARGAGDERDPAGEGVGR